MIILQKNGNATPSMAARLIERLPDQDDPRRPAEEKLVQDVVVVSFIGRYNVNVLEMDDHLFFSFIRWLWYGEQSMKWMDNAIKSIIRHPQQPKRYSWRWHCNQKSRRKPKQKLTLW